MPLATWNDGPAKAAITAFVDRVTDAASPDFVPESSRIAVFDNDGTLWPEQPMYVQLAFALDRVRTLAPQHPEWRGQQPFQAILDGDLSGLATVGERGIVELVMATHTGNTTREFARIVTDWLESARHPRYQRPYTELVYQPMVELLGFLRERGFTTYIVSAGGVEFVRPWAERVYGVPPQQVIGSGVKVTYELRDGEPTLVRQPAVEFVNDGPGKPVAIHRFVGRRPIAAFGNADGDLPMLQYTAGGPGARLLALVHHTDGEREYAYDRRSRFGRLDAALEAALDHGWTVIDVRRDWRVIWAHEAPEARPEQPTA